MDTMNPGIGYRRHRKATLSFLLPFLLLPALITMPRPAAALTNEALLDTLQRTAFNFFWFEANPANGLIRDRSTGGSPASIASVGFGLSAICVGIDHGWVTRTDGRARVLTTLNTFWTGPQGSAASGTIGYKGFFYHFLDMNTARRFTTWSNVELSSIDTALLLAGILDCRQYFNTSDPLDIQVRALADSIYRRTDWEFMRNSGVGLRMGWLPGTGFSGFGTWTGYNESMIMYLLALGSPTHPNPTSVWGTWFSTYSWQTHYGHSFVVFPPLFGHQYSHCWVDFRNKDDYYMRFKNITYFDNSRLATLAQRDYCIANPGGWTGYSGTLWGLTASDGPFGYNARGAPPAQNDDGTITPTAAAGSIPFAPEVVIPTLHNFFDNYPLLWGPYGFKDALNPTWNWYATDYIGIDQGPILLMIENHRNEKIWQRFMTNPYIQTGLARAGFLDIVGVEEVPRPDRPRAFLFQNSPNPFEGSTRISFELAEPADVRLRLFDVHGRLVRSLADDRREAGVHEVLLDGRTLAPGVYWYRLETDGVEANRRSLVVR